MPKKTKMDIEDRLVHALALYPSRTWVNNYFDLVKKVLLDLQIENDDPRLALNLTTEEKLPFNLGQRYILRPCTDGFVGLITPLPFDEEAYEGQCTFYFTTRKIQDAKFVELLFDSVDNLPAFIYNSMLKCAQDCLDRSKKSGYRRFHESFLYEFAMEQSLRNEILNEVNFMEE